MTDALKTAVAFLFRTKGVGRMKESAMNYALSFDLHWFSPEDAAAFIAKAVDMNVLAKKDGYLVPNFEHEKLEVPLSFRPGTDIIGASGDETGTGGRQKKDEEPLFISILKKMEKVTTLSREQLMAKINWIQGSMDIDIEVAALIVASDFDMDIKPLAKLVEEEIISRNG